MHKSNRIQVDPKLSDVVCSFLPVQCALFSEMLLPREGWTVCVLDLLAGEIGAE
jgi:hypothetical protein